MSRADEPEAKHQFEHRTARIGWLRAAVLGANDGIVSVASLLVGVAASDVSRRSLLIAGLAGVAAGALSMSVGEYVSVSSQRDTEQAEMAMEALHQQEHPEFEHEELVRIYEHRGLDRPLAEQVATRLMQVDPLGSHLRDELGFSDTTSARPLQAALVSAGSFIVGSCGPVVAAALAGRSLRLWVVAAVALMMLGLSGWVGGGLGGASKKRAAMRVLLGGSLAMAVTAIIGNVVGAAVG